MSIQRALYARRAMLLAVAALAAGMRRSRNRRWPPRAFRSGRRHTPNRRLGEFPRNQRHPLRAERRPLARLRRHARRRPHRPRKRRDPRELWARRRSEVAGRPRLRAGRLGLLDRHQQRRSGDEEPRRQHPNRRLPRCRREPDHFLGRRPFVRLPVLHGHPALRARPRRRRRATRDPRRLGPGLRPERNGTGARRTGGSTDPAGTEARSLASMWTAANWKPWRTVSGFRRR